MIAFRPAAACLRALANNEGMVADEIRARLGEVADFIEAAVNAEFYAEAAVDMEMHKEVADGFHWTEARLHADQAKVLRRWFPDAEISSAGGLKQIIPGVASLIVSSQGHWGICPCLNPEAGPINPVYGRGLTRLGSLYSGIPWPDVVIAWKRYYTEQDLGKGIVTPYTFEVP